MIPTTSPLSNTNSGPRPDRIVIETPACVTSSGLVRRAGKTIMTPGLESLFDRPFVPESDVDQSGFYNIQSSVGPKRWPRVTEILDGMGGKHHLVRWIVKTEKEAVRAAAVGSLLSTTLGDGPLISRADAVARMQRLTPVMETERIKGLATRYGSRTHSLVEDYLKTGKLPVLDSSDPDGPALLLSFGAFREYWDSAGLTPVKVEQRTYCPACGIAGTLDILARDTDGRLLIADLKTSKRISPVEMSMQLSCYRHCAALTEGEPIDSAMIIRVPKGQKTSRAKAEVRRFDKDELDAAYAAFLAALKLYRFQRQVEGHDYGDEPLGGH